MEKTFFSFGNLDKSYSNPGNVEIQLFPGEYQLTCYGAKGGNGFDNGNPFAQGGKGSITKGTIQIQNLTKFYLNIGGMGISNEVGGQKGGFNGGGDSGTDYGFGDHYGNDGGGSGGGASDIRIRVNDESTRIMVAAGGSGASTTCEGAPGGLEIPFKIVKSGYKCLAAEDPTGHTSTGKGEKGEDNKIPAGTGFPGSGGGGGYFGGVGGIAQNSLITDPAKCVGSSGTSFISGCLNNKIIEKTALTSCSWYNGLDTTYSHPDDGLITIKSTKVYDICQQATDLTFTSCEKCASPLFRTLEKDCSSQCDPGTKKDYSTYICQTCLPGTFGTGKTSFCTKCMNNTYTSNPGESACSICSRPGYGVNSDNSECAPCSNGKFGNNGICEECPSGQFTNSSMQTKCNLCPENTFSNSTGSSACENCPPGTYSHSGWSNCQTNSFQFSLKFSRFDQFNLMCLLNGLLAII